MINKYAIALANHISGIKQGSKKGVQPVGDPRYKILEPVITKELCEVGLCLELRVKMSAADVAPKCNKTIEEAEKLLWDLSMIGVTFVNKIDGVDKYWFDTWVPGVMEMMVNNKELVAKYPQIAEAFDEYGSFRAPLTTGNVPVGKGPMRTIPIESAIDGETKSASYEEVTHYLNSSEIFSVSDCSCRTSRESQGEGCGHPKEDMCIQLGHAAEYYIRTGRGREITREEALAIIIKAEENGLVHQIPNLDGSGETHAICNCCGCGCFALRFSRMFSNTDMCRSNYVSVVDEEKCVGCGECVEACNLDALQLGKKLCSEDNIQKEEVRLPYDREWSEKDWIKDYRTNQKVVTADGTAPCKAKCPAHISVPGYIKLASQGRYNEALEVIKNENPFPAVCGRICPRSCESECTRGDIDSPVSIDEIKKFIADQDLSHETRYVPKKRHDFGNKIAVIGSGPAGLSCAYYLALDGYEVTVFEKQNVIGGMLTLGIPSFRLDKDVINAEIDVLRELGIKFETGVNVGEDVTLDELRKKGFEAFYIGIGAQIGRNLNIEGEDAQGVQTGVDFLRKVGLGDKTPLTGKTIVIGGGNVAIDVARTATRISSKNVDMFCLENRQAMPALLEEIDEALSEDISINNSWGPKRIVVEGGKVIGIEMIKCLSVLDENGRFAPKFDEQDTKIVKADNIIVSVGQGIDWGNMLNGSKAKLKPNKTIIADDFTYQTGQEDIFVGGDSYTGPKFAIDAIAQGKEGAESIHRFVSPGHSLVIGRIRRDYTAFDKSNIELEGYDNIPRQSVTHVQGNVTKETFKDLRGTFTEEQILAETERCIRCGVTEVAEHKCVGCGICTTKCHHDAISLVRKYDAEGSDLRELKPIIVKQMLKRKVKIAVKKPIRGIKSVLKD